MVKVINWFCALLLLCSVSQAQVVRLHVELPNAVGDATAVCVGHDSEGFGVYLTAAHNFRDARSARIQVHGRWYKAYQRVIHPTADVATFTSHPTEICELADVEPIGESVRIPGYGPEYNGRQASAFGGRIIESGLIEGNDGLHPIPGDSGAPVIHNQRVCGIVSGYVIQDTVFRSDYSDRKWPTRYVTLAECREVLTQVYSRCGPGGCRIWIRPEVRQPIGILGLPTGPPRVVNVAEPVPRVFVPEDQVQVPQPKPDPISTQGPPGRDGKDGQSVTPEQVSAIVRGWLEDNREDIAKASVDWSGLESRVKALERRPFTLILAEDGKEVDREVYAPGQPVVLDIRRFKK